MKRKLFIQATQQHKYQFLETGKLNIKKHLRNITRLKIFDKHGFLRERENHNELF